MTASSSIASRTASVFHRTRHIFSIVAAAFASLTSATSARAADTSHADGPPTPTLLRPFDKGTWTLDLAGDYVVPLNEPEHFAGGWVGFGFAPRDGVVVGLDAQADALLDHDGHDDGFAGGADLKARLRLFDWHDASFFFDATVGVLESSVSVPREAGSNFTFRETLGLGAYVPLAHDVLLLSGVRFEHISNSGIHEPNPGYNGLQFYVGVTLPL